ncbi:CcmB protein [Selenomonas noxia ATCC 43541]|jgi:heme ABC superfamily ATP binding cassette transporter, membrane protein|nr:CcmB protein [Selenomonas noxia ATCC 43541]
MGMFALTVIAFISMSLAGSMADGRLTAALLWVVIFFAATLQGERLFAEEAAAGTLLFLRIYVPAQAVLFGKMAAHFVTLLVLTVIVLPLILILMDAPFVLDAMLGAVLFLGLWGMAAADTLLAAVAANASVRGGLIPVLLLPSMLPILLPAIALTAGEGEPALLGGMLIYDMALTVGASMLFDSLWIES